MPEPIKTPEILDPAFLGTTADRVYLMESPRAVALAGRVPHEKNADEWKGTEHHDNPSWIGCTNAEARKRLESGWPEGTQRIFENLGRLMVAPPVSRKRKRTRGEFGDECDIQKVYSGQLDTAWETRTRRDVQGPAHITLIPMVNESSRATADELFWRGAAACALADSLEMAGYQVKILALYSVYNGWPNGPQRVIMQTIVKEHSQPLDIDAVAGVLANPSFFRYHIFHWMESLPWTVGAGYGSPMNETESLTFAPGTIGGFRPVNDQASARAKIEQEIARLESRVSVPA